jgi:vacuolar-type H+-ATPase subunit F/Vma7
VRLDEKSFLTGLVMGLWNFSSRSLKLLAGSFIFVETTAFRKLGGFSNELFAAEELELSKRLKQFARGTGTGIVILHRHPLVTSARKMRLYTMRDHLKLLVRVLFKHGTLTSRESCTLWYDGRR